MGMVFMDISKAFDAVDHSSLLQELQDFSFSGSFSLWFENYLSGRYQRVTVHGFTSTLLSITSGAPQGSLVGPFLRIHEQPVFTAGQMLTGYVSIKPNAKSYP